MLGILETLSGCALVTTNFMLLAKILWTCDCTGISGKTQVLFAITFAGRYLDIALVYYAYPLSISFISIVAFIAVTYCTVLSIYFFYSRTYESKYDTFRIELLIFPCIVLSLLANYNYDIISVFRAFSMYLEAVAILPQAHHVSQAKRVEGIVYYYVSGLTTYKALHVMGATYAFFMNRPYDRISFASGVVALMFFCDFFTTASSLRRAEITEVNDEEARIDNNAGSVVKYSKEEEAARSAQQAESNGLDGFMYHDNLKEIVLTPKSLGDTSYPVTVAMPAEKEAKETNVTAIRA